MLSNGKIYTRPKLPEKQQWMEMLGRPTHTEINQVIWMLKDCVVHDNHLVEKRITNRFPCRVFWS